jgi:thiol-disulfide isomerase/thioredoxin
MDDISSIRSTPRPTSRRFAWLLAACLVLAVPACAKHDAAKGKPLPEANLSSLATGKPADWDAKGRPLVINFWASWCTPCRAEMPAFEAVHQRLGDQVAIVGVTDEDDHAASANAAKKSGAAYPLLVDEDQTLLTDLRVSGLPGTVFVDADGKVIGRHLGALTEAELTKEIKDRYGITA